MAPFDTFNLGDHVGDDPVAVTTNRNRLAAAIGLGAHQLIWMNQVHGVHVEYVDAPRTEAFDATDALVTTTPRLALAVVTADCVPVLMADTRAGVLGAAHAGRVGAADGVVPPDTEAMLAAGARHRRRVGPAGPRGQRIQLPVSEEMAADVEARPGSRTTTPGGGLRWICRLVSPVNSSTPASPPSTPTRGVPSLILHCSPTVGTRRPVGWRRWCGCRDVHRRHGHR